jgi:hypothetical protein
VVHSRCVAIQRQIEIFAGAKGRGTIADTGCVLIAEYRSVSLAERISRWTVCVPVDAMGASQPRFVLEQKVFDENGFEETVLLQPRLSSLRNDTVYIFAGCGDEIAEVGSSDLHVTFKQVIIISPEGKTKVFFLQCS